MERSRVRGSLGLDSEFEPQEITSPKEKAAGGLE